MDYDVIVIGTGAAGQTVAHACKAAGKAVAIIDKRAYGGTCAKRGCDPKKVLRAPAAVLQELSDLSHVLQGSASIDWKKLQEFKQSFTEPVSEGVRKGLDDAGIDTLSGLASFTGKNTVRVEDRELAAENIVIATGSEPRPLGIPGEEHVLSSEAFMELSSLPERIVFIGGGYISFEFAHMAARAGSTCTILHRSGQVLKGFDPFIVEKAVEASEDAGIKIVTDAPVKEAEEDGVVTESDRYETDIVVHGAGRVPQLEELGLDKAGVDRDKRGVKVDKHLRSESNEHVWACGDAAGLGLPLTPVAGRQGQVVTDNILGKERVYDPDAIPTVCFTIPPLASVGMQDVPDDGEEHKGETGGWFSSSHKGNEHAGYRILTKDDRIVGAHLFGPGAEEVINIFAIAISQDMPTSVLKDILFAYPTATSDIKYMF